MNTKKVIIRRRDGLWYAQTPDGIDHYILNQIPDHAILSVGRDENRQAFAVILDGPGGRWPAADFKDFVH